MKQGVAGGARLRPGKSVVHLDSLDRMVKTALRDEFEYYLEHQAELGVCAAEKTGLNIKWNAALLTTTCSSRSCRKSSYGVDS